MNDVPVSIVGNVVSEPRFVVTESGVPLASLRVVSRPRRYDRQRAAWVDGEPNHFTVNCWRTLAENVASSVGRGDPVVVTGRLRVRAARRDANGELTRGMSVEVDATSVGHDLRWGTTAYRRMRRETPPAEAALPAMVDAPALSSASDTSEARESGEVTRDLDKAA
jgi:single-strand DNA-binding protein